MHKSARLTALIASFLVFLVPCSQFSFIQARSFPSSLQPNGKAVKKKAKKKRKKKKTVSMPYLGVQLPTVLPDAIKETRFESLFPNESNSTVSSIRPTNRITSRPGLHVKPIVRSEAGVPSVSVTNSNPINISDTNPDQDPFPADPYPSEIEVNNLVGIVTSVSVTINGLSHPNPDDLDMLLVSPDDRTFHFWSDVGGGALVPPGGSSPPPVTVTVSDSAAQPLPDEGPLESTTYRPFNADTNGDFFPGVSGPYNEPAPAGKSTFASVFNGMNDLQANGTWRLFVTDDQNQAGGVIAGGWTINITTEIPATSAGQVVISEFRTSGPLGSLDEFVELYNTTGAPLNVHSSDDSEGLGLFASDGILRCVIPNGTIIPVNGHYLCANDGQTQAGAVDQFFTTDIPDNAGLALFNTSATGQAFQTMANRIDAVGPNTADPLYREGPGITPLDQPTLDYTFYRDLRPNGQPKDTNNNIDDFLFVDTSGAATSSGQRLGAPSPEGLRDPKTSNDLIAATLPAPCEAATSAPNRVRSSLSDPANNSTLGTLSIRRAITNLTENEITALRFKVIAITSFPVTQTGTADLRLLTSSNSVEEDPCNSGNTFTLMGLSLDGPPQPKGGAFNSNVSADILSLGQPLQPGQTIYVNFLLGVQQTGRFQFFVNIETLP